MLELIAGQRVDLPAGPLELHVDADRPEPLDHAALVVVALAAGGGAPADFAAVNTRTRELRPGIAFAADSLRFDLASVPADVERLVVVLYFLTGPGGGVTARDLGALTVAVGDGHRLKLDLRDRGESALTLVEFYRRGAGWRLMANGQGFVGGLPAVASALGVAISAPMATPTRPEPGGGHDHRQSRPPPGGSASGSGFAVDSRLILTNHHVIEDARTVEVAGERMTSPAEVLLADPRNDIALLQIEKEVGGVARFRDDLDIHLGEDVIVLGFPLQGLLGSGPQVSAGNVSALCGIGNDSSQLQFTAPIASGNSGGPILDSAGLVIGLVRAALNVDHVRQGGGIAENINFGVKGALVRAFLATAGVTAPLAPAAPARPRAEIAKAGRDFIYRIRCGF